MNLQYTFLSTLGGYLRRCGKPLLLAAACTAVAAAVLLLYAVPGEALLYALLLCAVLCLAALLTDFFRYRRRHLRLLARQDAVVLGMDQFPTPRSQIEQDYDALLRAVQADKDRRLSQAEALLTDAQQYYTVWTHQIKTPIAAMKLLLRQQDSELSRELSAELFKIEQYVELVLSYQRLNSESSDFVLRRYPLQDIVRQSVKKYAPLFNRKRISLELRPFSLDVLTDEKWLCFVVGQLLSNALKYTPPGGRITIWTELPATLLIQDTGIGIRAEDLPRVCEKGYTGCNGRTDKQATGIGLYLCRQVLDRLGHALTLRSTPGYGTTVLIDLESAQFYSND